MRSIDEALISSQFFHGFLIDYFHLGKNEMIKDT